MRFFLAVSFLSLTACAAEQSVHQDETPYLSRAELQRRDGFIVAAAALSAKESWEVFGMPLNGIGIQPVWLRVDNLTDRPQWIFPIGIDADYFPSYEVARRSSAFYSPASWDASPREIAAAEAEVHHKLEREHIPYFVPPRTSVSGFVYAHNDEGMKAFDVELHGEEEIHSFHFVVPVPGLPSDYFDLDPEAIYENGTLKSLSREGLRQWLELQPCCAVNGDGKVGDPLNIVLVGSLDEVRSALISRHWDVTAPVTNASLWRTVSALIFGSRYRYAPISALYVFDREHDLAFQKARAVIDERNHMRLWLAPVTFEGRHVWIGQISRDVGIKLSGRFWPPTTHVIDPDMDDARFLLKQDLLAGRSVEQLGYVRGHEEVSLEEPHVNAEDDPYFTDGLRAVFFLAEQEVPAAHVELLEWELPGQMRPYRNQVFAE